MDNEKNLSTNENEIEQEEQVTDAVGTDTQSSTKTKTRWKFCLPIVKEVVEVPAKKKKGKPAKDKKRCKERLADFVRGVGTSCLILGTGLVAYGIHRMHKDEELANGCIEEGPNDEYTDLTDLPPEEQLGEEIQKETEEE